ncbi:MAG: glycine--tRNA ligase subunit beta, partial [Acidiphilium sp.]|nr:glycine--tRNA ligase subunit beta [Acidiphilium sp.]
ADRADLVEEGEHVLLRRTIAARPAADVILTDLARALAAFPWPKSMRWGQSGGFTWVRPLRRIVCLLDGAVVPIALGPVVASDLSEGHRFLAPGTFHVTSKDQWETELASRYVAADAVVRRAIIEKGLRSEATKRGLVIVTHDDLLDEICGLVECPVPLIGRIEHRFMALPPEVRELSMRVNQRFFSTRDAAGYPAPYFAFVANIEASDGGAVIIAGNERVLRARLADAEHFWTLDRRHPLASYLPKLKAVIFHAKLGTQFERAERIEKVASEIARRLGASLEESEQAARAGLLCKADLVTGMVAEFPELQGVMGSYYADDAVVGAAIRTHYQPKGPMDDVPLGTVACAVALADKIDTLQQFFRIGEKPTGSGDPFALRRAALGVNRIILENKLHLNLFSLLGKDVFDFLVERLRVKLRAEGKRFDVLNAVLSTAADDDLFRIQQRVDALGDFIVTDDGANLLVAYRRSVNILQIEEAKDGPHEGNVSDALLNQTVDLNLHLTTTRIEMMIESDLAKEDFTAAMIHLAVLRPPVDEFFNSATVNAEDPVLRRNRLRLLAKLRDVMHRVADFSKLEG